MKLTAKEEDETLSCTFSDSEHSASLEFEQDLQEIFPNDIAALALLHVLFECVVEKLDYVPLIGCEMEFLGELGKRAGEEEAEEIENSPVEDFLAVLAELAVGILEAFALQAECHVGDVIGGEARQNLVHFNLSRFVRGAIDGFDQFIADQVDHLEHRLHFRGCESRR